MKASFDDTVLDTLFPGLGAIPPASRAGLDATAVLTRHGAVLTAIAAAAGGEAAFVAADTGTRAGLVETVGTAEPAAFQALVLAVSALYHASAPVVEAYGWVARAPQPRGFAVGAPTDEAEAAQLLEKVRARRQIWRA
ncbi:MAG: hypothetical protein Q8O26_16205 [Phreatobacter sp.]|uniref:hypothetical protein n=1 Tax=Phreatobacter sp. TaxID=1966341 RepID=UPI0027326FBC|nr:hypothetical protein [Phreatobacter sp.]MDP2803416.1 hypothetical protein [Phreatobacter sp.]